MTTAPANTLRSKLIGFADKCFMNSGGGTRLLPMEGLRGLAVLAVFCVHVHAVFGPHLATYPRLFGTSEYLGRIGNAGVDLFFVLSGFLIYGTLIHKRVSYPAFLLRRVRRIYPAFLVVLSCYLWLSVVRPSESRVPAHASAALKYLLENILLLPGITRIPAIVTVAWSLSFEFAFYAFVPLIVFLSRRCGAARIRRAALLVACALAFCELDSFFFHGAHIRMLSFFSGMLLHEAAASDRIRFLLSRTGQWISIFAVVLLASYHFGLWTKDSGAGSSGILSAMLMSTALSFLVLYALQYPGALRKLCAWRPMRYWGNISYSYYLAHGITLKGVAAAMLFMGAPSASIASYLGGVTVGFLATLASAAVLYLVVERPFSIASGAQRLSISKAPIALIPSCIRRQRSAPEISGL